MSSQENVYFSNDNLQTNVDSFVIDGDLCEEVSENLLPTNIYRNVTLTSNDDNIDNGSNDSNDSENDDTNNNSETDIKSNNFDENMNFPSINSGNNEDQNEFIADNDFGQNNSSHIENQEKNIPEKKKRGLPKSILANQQKYLEILEKQNRMSNKNKKINNPKNIKDEEIPKAKINVDGPKRRVIIGGKVKYLPINKFENNEQDKQILTVRDDDKLLSETEISKIIPQKIVEPNTENNPENNTENDNDLDENSVKIDVIKKRRPVTMNKFLKNTKKNNTNLSQNIEEKTAENIKEKAAENIKEKAPENIEEVERKIPSSIAKKMEMHAAKQAKEVNLPGRKNKSGTKKIPSKYAKQMENDVKKQTVRNVKSFSDLRRIKTLQDISSGDIQDTNKASMTELRKLRMEQKKREQAELRKKSEDNKKESAVQEILKNDKMSKFAKVVAIKNLSVNSRNRRRNMLQNKADKY
ncbi:hypothetical protein ma596 [Moumouvirus australiensis]|uniref:Uncharacterized protein n=1 Tax=Moumouvirus australiensis TaxID=2109587 RepID=A0A2P1EMA5_9VIRU|nr:hypothetical protein QKC55_gp309 [Moumouvirus australiensis]AVL94982.1 hypothetical protein ma596 [Moumouvirus australiensis]